jgi:alkylation response protein AidB-like acyl-CoA dehydrogenase
MHQPGETYDDIREAVGKLCAQFPGSYWRALDREMAYPAAFVQALTEAGWLGALIPEDFGGSGLPLSAAAVILEEIHRSGGNAGACHAQMYTMGTLLRHGSEAQKRQYLPKDRRWNPAIASLWRNRAQLRHRYWRVAHHRQARWVRLCHQWAENLDQPSRAFRPHAAFGAH